MTSQVREDKDQGLNSNDSYSFDEFDLWQSSGEDDASPTILAFVRRVHGDIGQTFQEHVGEDGQRVEGSGSYQEQQQPQAEPPDQTLEGQADGNNDSWPDAPTLFDGIDSLSE